MSNFCFVFIILGNPPIEIGEIIGICVAQVVLINAHFDFSGSLPNFYRGGKNLNFWQNFRQGSESAAYYSTTGRNIEIEKNGVRRWLSLSYNIHSIFGGARLKNNGE